MSGPLVSIVCGDISDGVLAFDQFFSHKFISLSSLSPWITTDVQPSTSPNAICIFVTGAVKLGGPNPIHFCEFIQLVSAGDNNFTIHNCIFRLNYGL
jgi:hypothetical protein